MTSRKTFAILLAICAIYILPFNAHGAEKKKLWDNMCSSCHDGKTAPSPAALREKYPTVETFRTAVHSKGNRCMNILKNDEKLIDKIAAELGIGETKAK